MSSLNKQRMRMWGGGEILMVPKNIWVGTRAEQKPGCEQVQISVTSFESETKAIKTGYRISKHFFWRKYTTITFRYDPNKRAPLRGPKILPLKPHKCSVDREFSIPCGCRRGGVNISKRRLLVGKSGHIVGRV